LTIRNSVNFNFAGISSETMGLINVNLDSGMYEENLSPSKTINEIKIRGRSKPYHQNIEYEPLEFSVSFAFLETWDKTKLRQVTNWLCNQSYYKPLYFSDDLDEENNPTRIYYAMVHEKSDIVHNGLSQGYVNITFRCNDAFKYSPVYTTDELTFNSNIITETTESDFSQGTLSDVIATEDGKLTLDNTKSIGYRISPVYDLNYFENTALYISWDSTVPVNTTLNIQYSLSLDDGDTWSNYINLTNENSFAFVDENNDLLDTSNAKIKFKMILSSTDLPIVPSLSSITIDIMEVYTFTNDGDLICSPILDITKINNGNVVIINLSDNNTVFSFMSLIGDEIVSVDNENEIITSSIIDRYPMNLFSNNFLKLPSGDNYLAMLGNFKLQMKYEFKYF